MHLRQKLERTLKILNWSKILTSVCRKMATFAPEYVEGNAKVNASKWSHRNSPPQKKNKTKNEEINFSSKNSFLHSHHQTLGRRSLHIMHWLESEKNMQTCKSTLRNITVNFQSCAGQQRFSQESSFTDVYLTILTTELRKKSCVWGDERVRFACRWRLLPEKNLPLHACLQDS